jgi:hypothetical protein
MKINISKIITVVFLLVAGLSSTSCEDYLNVLPKGKKIPTTLADYEALLRDEYSNQTTNIEQANILLNDRYVSAYYMSYYPLWKANFNWDESADRVKLNDADESTYYNQYMTINTCNLIVENAPESTEATEAQKNEVMAYAKVIRAMSYYVLVNYYAQPYQQATAASESGVPLIESANLGASYEQVSVKEIYDYIIKNVTEAIPYLPDYGTTIIHPGLGAAYAFLARVYLTMADYTNAEKYADMALAINNKLYDWTAFYATNQVQIEKPASYTRLVDPAGYNYVENFYFRHGSSKNSTAENSIIIERTSLFENGDARFKARWKRYTVGADTYYYSTLTSYHNHGGFTTTEVYLIKAECQARANKLPQAMTTLNTVRRTRILAASYQDLTASSIADAIGKIRRTKDNELLFSIVPFADARRLNAEGTYANTRTFSKTVGGSTVTLSSTSHMWTMPFPQGAIDNPGNGTIKQNVAK